MFNGGVWQHHHEKLWPCQQLPALVFHLISSQIIWFFFCNTPQNRRATNSSTNAALLFCTNVKLCNISNVLNWFVDLSQMKLKWSNALKSLYTFNEQFCYLHWTLFSCSIWLMYLLHERWWIKMHFCKQLVQWLDGIVYFKIQLSMYINARWR